MDYGIQAMQVKTQPPHLPRNFRKEITMERQGELYKIVRKLPAGTTLEGLEKLIAEGKIDSYARQGDHFVIYTSNPKMLDEVALLQQKKLPNVVLEKAKEVFLPPNMEENVAPEYLKFRGWAMGASVAANAISFANLSVTLDATHIALGTTEKIVLAQTINTYAWRLTSMGASFMGQKGDQDPRRYYTINQLVSMGNSMATLGVLSMLPQAYVPLSFGTSVLGACGSSLGSAANVNIFNHMAKNNKGLVQSKNSVQDLVASMLGAPVALGIRWGANKIGLSPALATVALLGPVQFLCAMNAASTIRMEPVSRDKLEQISDHYLKSGTFAPAPQPTVLGNLKSLWSGPEGGFSQKIEVCSQLDEVLQNNLDPKSLFSTFREDRYLLGLDSKTHQIRVGLRKDANLDDVVKAYSQARLIEKSEAKLLPAIHQLVGDEAPNRLVELIHRGLANSQGASQALADQGWHNNALKLKFPRLQGEWKGEPGAALPPVTREELMQHTESPDQERLKVLLGLS
jgi:hypothetical protein